MSLLPHSNTRLRLCAKCSTWLCPRPQVSARLQRLKEHLFQRISGALSVGGASPEAPARGWVGRWKRIWEKASRTFGSEASTGGSKDKEALLVRLAELHSDVSARES